MKTSLKCFIVIYALLNICSCSNEQLPIAATKKYRVKTLTRILTANPSVKEISVLKYNNAGRLASTYSYVTGSQNSLGDTSVFEYDSENRMIKMKRTLTTSQSESYLYNYNSSGTLSQIKYTAGGGDYFDVSFQYDNTNKLISSKKTFALQPALSFNRDQTFVIDHEDVTSMLTKTTFFHIITTTSTETTAFEFDNKVNPFYGIYLIPSPGGFASPSNGNFSVITYFGGVDNVLNLSRNNVVSAKLSESVGSTYTYTYNTADLPLTRTTWTKNLPSYDTKNIETLTFEYEEY